MGTHRLTVWQCSKQLPCETRGRQRQISMCEQRGGTWCQSPLPSSASSCVWLVFCLICHSMYDTVPASRPISNSCMDERRGCACWQTNMRLPVRSRSCSKNLCLRGGIDGEQGACVCVCVCVCVINRYTLNA